MRIPSGKTDQTIFFVAYDSSDHVTRKTGLSSFTVYRSRNAGTATIYTTPTVTELSAANMPGVYALTVDEDTTIASTSDSEEYCVHITCTNMDPVTRAIELYRRDTTTGRTLDVSSGGEAGLDWANIGSPTTTVDLSGTTIKTTQKVDVDTIKTNPVVNGGTITFPTTATLASTTNITSFASGRPIDKTLMAVARGTVTSGASTTSVPTSALTIAGSSASGVVADQFKNRTALFDGDTTTAGLRGAQATISANSASNTPTLTVGTLPATPASGDTFSIV